MRSTISRYLQHISACYTLFKHMSLGSPVSALIDMIYTLLHPLRACRAFPLDLFSSLHTRSVPSNATWTENLQSCQMHVVYLPVCLTYFGPRLLPQSRGKERLDVYPHHCCVGFGDVSPRLLPFGFPAISPDESCMDSAPPMREPC